MKAEVWQPVLVTHSLSGSFISSCLGSSKTLTVNSEEFRVLA